uniref:Uncharacterized protein n=1 Tax=Ditylenchus dipsaci TaxID=166011 RepID=A0A915CX29_9BILA
MSEEEIEKLTDEKLRTKAFKSNKQKKTKSLKRKKMKMRRRKRKMTKKKMMGKSPNEYIFDVGCPSERYQLEEALEKKYVENNLVSDEQKNEHKGEILSGLMQELRNKIQAMDDEHKKEEKLYSKNKWKLTK